MHRPDADNKSSADSEDVLKVFEETYDVGKLKTVTGRVRVNTTTENVEELVKTTLRGESLEVTRVPIDRIITEMPTVKTEGDLTIVPVVEEFLVIEKRLRLTEELHIRRRETEENIEIPITLRRQRAEIDRLHSKKD